ncbi:MAG: iron-sulfur cluster-binding domain-containing protein [Deltaproteobacteria bacterium]|jgi:ferredoxin-NADP reductase|nr:iron-sulfur cluster-binding domain-containing protein [Deltaproteobacteria bacterium]MBW2530498.1 iron-sulfur cluster-binding domain-containing protein [Deltaproteobacteria bacterium]
MVATVLSGGRTEPLVRRSGGRRYPRRPRSTSWILARVAEVVRETDQATSLWLERFDDGRWEFQPGQFLQVELMVAGALERRAYSISGWSPDHQRVRLTVKRLPGGRVSPILQGLASSGGRLRVAGPSGRFTASAGPGAPRQLLLIGGGSGITPLWSIARSVLDSEPTSRVSLLYGNRSREETIFAAEIDRSCARHPGRFEVRHVLAEPCADLPDARVGILDSSVLASELDRLLASAAIRPEPFLCGPPPVMAAARAELLARGYAAGEIREERFSSPSLLRQRQLGSRTPERLTVLGIEPTGSVEVLPGQTLLSAAQQAGLPLRSSCTMGGCGACKVALRAGEVELAEPNCLTAEERDGGQILPCVAHPRSAVTVEVSA